jgi:hypothetical protein
MNSSRPNGRKPSPRAVTAPERRSSGRTDAPTRVAKAFYRARLSFTKSEHLEPDFVPGYN